MNEAPSRECGRELCQERENRWELGLGITCGAGRGGGGRSGARDLVENPCVANEILLQDSFITTRRAVTVEL